MAVYTHLDEGFARYMLSVYPDAGELVSLTGIPAGSINTSYKLETTKGAFFLRVAENKAFSDLVYEKNLLLFLEERAARLSGVTTPRMVQNSAGGYFFPVGEGAGRPVKYACLFEALRGRDLAVFELSPAHVEQVGELLARAHLTLRRFHGGRKNPYGVPVLAAWLAGLRHAGLEPALLARLEASFARLSRARRPLPRGVIHGDLFLNNTKWHRGQLDAVFDWEMAGRDHLALDVGITLNAWCWRRDGEGGGAFDRDMSRALLAGYERVRPLAPSERRGLYVETCFGALRFTLSRIRDFGTKGEARAEVVDAFAPKEERALVGAGAPEVEAAREEAQGGASAEPQRDFLDYREYEQRLRALERMGPAAFASLVGLDSGLRSR